MEIQQTVIDMQKQALDRLVAVQGKVQAILIQNYELHEYPILRLFIVLPKDSSRWDPVNLFQNKFRLYFLCECGEHTKSGQNSNTPHRTRSVTRVSSESFGRGKCVSVDETRG